MQIERPKAYRVDLIEHERGWGSKVDDRIYFDNEEEAKEYIRKYNAKNDKPYVPDWYMTAEGPYKL